MKGLLLYGSFLKKSGLLETSKGFLYGKGLLLFVDSLPPGLLVDSTTALLVSEGTYLKI